MKILWKKLNCEIKKLWWQFHHVLARRQTKSIRHGYCSWRRWASYKVRERERRLISSKSVKENQLAEKKRRERKINHQSYLLLASMCLIFAITHDSRNSLVKMPTLMVMMTISRHQSSILLTSMLINWREGKSIKWNWFLIKMKGKSCLFSVDKTVKKLLFCEWTLLAFTHACGGESERGSKADDERKIVKWL